VLIASKIVAEMPAHFQSWISSGVFPEAAPEPDIALPAIIQIIAR
jgi:hypothetical protein